MNRTQKIQAIVWLEKVAEAAADYAKQYRQELDAEARAEYAVQGTSPSWKVRDVATVSGRVSNDSIAVGDPAALFAWVEDRHPHHIERTIRPSFVDWLRKNAYADHNGAVCDPETGEAIPGLLPRPGGAFLGIGIRVAAEAEAVFGALADEALRAAALTAAPAIAPELTQLVAGETPGHLEPGEVAA